LPYVTWIASDVIQPTNIKNTKGPEMVIVYVTTDDVQKKIPGVFFKFMLELAKQSITLDAFSRELRLSKPDINADLDKRYKRVVKEYLKSTGIKIELVSPLGEPGRYFRVPNCTDLQQNQKIPDASFRKPVWTAQIKLPPVYNKHNFKIVELI